MHMEGDKQVFIYKISLFSIFFVQVLSRGSVDPSFPPFFPHILDVLSHGNSSFGGSPFSLQFFLSQLFKGAHKDLGQKVLISNNVFILLLLFFSSTCHLGGALLLLVPLSTPLLGGLLAYERETILYGTRELAQTNPACGGIPSVAVHVVDDFVFVAIWSPSLCKYFF